MGGHLQASVIRYDSHPDGKMPYPIHVDVDGIVRSGLGGDDGARLLGFGPRDAQKVTVPWEDALEAPESVVGLVATFGFGNVFAWDIPVAKFELVEEATG